MTQEPIIKVENLTHVYPGGLAALKGVSLEIYPQEFVSIIGQNGSGKTTLVKHFNGLLKPTEGEVIVDGLNTREVSIRDLSLVVGYNFQNPYHQVFADKVETEVAFGPRNLDLTEEEIEERVTLALKTVEMEDYRDDFVVSLSRANIQRIAVADILAMKPKVLVFDEPTTGQDWRGSKAIMDLLVKLNKEGHTIVIITHNIPMVANYSQRAILMCQGEVLEDGTVKEVLPKTEQMACSHLIPPSITLLAQKFQDNRIPKDIIHVDEFAKAISKL